MTSKIKILPEILSNKIAAGEVVERPASVVKEMVENALDAGSSRIVIEVAQGGKSLIRISDDGTGMGHDDALLALERYATSKIYTDRDLFDIRTLGFRGEALPSIAAVSRFSLVTREKDAEQGTEIIVDGGKIRQVSDTGAPAGTMITVKQLFFNTPARRKFLKSVNTEMGHVADSLAGIAMGWPRVRFRLIHNKRVIKDWPAAPDATDRVADVLGGEVRPHLFRLQTGRPDVSISGWLAASKISRSNARGIYIYVNGRYVKDRIVRHALFEGYAGRLMKGRFPVAVLFIEVPSDRVDVNVHPTKHEVRFADQKTVHDTVARAAAETLREEDRSLWTENGGQGSGAGGQGPEVGGQGSGVRGQGTDEGRGTRDGGRRASDFALRASSRQGGQGTNGGRGTRDEGRRTTGGNIGYGAKGMGHGAKGQGQRGETDEQEWAFVRGSGAPGVSQMGPGYQTTHRSPDAVDGVPTPPAVHGVTTGTPTEPSHGQQSFWRKGRFADTRIVGQYHGTYIVCESDKGMVLVDQHAAHERILFEQLQDRSTSTPARSQKLLLPETIELGYREAAALEKLTPEFNRIGFDIEPFGGNTFVIKAVPAMLSEKDVRPIVMEMVEKAATVGFGTQMEKALDACRMLMACHGAIRANQSLSEGEIRQLLTDLDGCDDPSHCPHGRPTFIRWTVKELEKAFGRI